MKRKLFAIGVLALAMTGCRQMEELQPQPNATDAVVFVAQTEDFDSSARTTLNAEGVMVWSASDQIALFEGATTATQYEINTGAGTNYAEFTVVSNEDNDDDFSGDWVRSVRESFDANVALYPYAAELACTATLENEALVSCTVSGITLPSVQTYVANSFAEGAFPMVAITDSKSDNVLQFKNVGGALNNRFERNRCR